MNTHVLIESIVRQTTVLIAQLATSGGLRAPLSHLANQVFFDLAKELESQGISRKVSADMFGMALRTYLRKLSRLSESSTERGRSLWEAVYEYLCEQSVASRAQVIERFSKDDEAVVRGILHDLVESGLAFVSGSEPEAVFRAAGTDELGSMRRIWAGQPDELLWALIYREGPLSIDDLAARYAGTGVEVRVAIERLAAAGRVVVTESDGERSVRASEFVVSLGATSGSEAAVYDHFHAVVKTVCAKLRVGAGGGVADTIGGSTYTFEVWGGHPFDGEVRGFLSRFRHEQTALRQKVEKYNAERGIPEDHDSVVVYGGQCITEQHHAND